MDVILPQWMCFWYEKFPSNLENLFRDAEKYSYDGAIIPVSNPLFTREFENKKIAANHEQFTRSALIASHIKWDNNVIPKIGECLDCDSSDQVIREHSQKTLEQELKYAEYLRNKNSVLIRLKSGNIKQMVRVISRTVRHANIIVEVPLVDPLVAKRKWICHGGGDISTVCGTDTWTWWNKFRSLCDDLQISLALDINVPAEEFPSWRILRRWLGEPVRMVILPSYLFSKNESNCYCLPQSYKFIFELMKCHFANVAIKAVYQSDEDIRKYVEISKFLTCQMRVDNLWNCHFNILTKVPPPIRDDYSNTAYIKMEKDPVKYRLYQKAFEFALLHRPEQNRVAVLIAGAGRGCLVRMAVNAGKNTKRPMKIYCVEINEGAVFNLKHIQAELWPNLDIDVILSDIRDFKPPEPFDFIISDFLGGFGDNNLYPELIYPMCKYLKADGMCIPYKITSYLNPVMSMIKHDLAKSLGMTIFVGSFYEVYHIDKPKPVFEYNFPNPKGVEDYERHKKLTFTAEIDCLLHGFNGYFDCYLYEDISFSIVPGNFTQGLASWCPLFFPIQIPMNIKARETIEMNIWRCVSKHEMWYEWNVESPQSICVQNSLGIEWNAELR